MALSVEQVKNVPSYHKVTKVRIICSKRRAVLCPYLLSIIGTDSILAAFLAVVRIIHLFRTGPPLPDIGCNVLVDRLESVLHSQEMGL
jgi:hypothetical protein